MKFLRGSALIFLAALLWTCSSTPTNDDEFKPQLSERRGSVSRKWDRQLPGLATEISMSRDGKRVLVAIVPNPESSKRTIRDPALAMLDHRGETIWQQKLDARVKWITLAPNGDLAWATTYEGKLKAFDGRGKQIWETDNYCRPYFLASQGRLFCFRGDDAKPTGVGFEVYDLMGRRIDAFGVSSEVIDYAVSGDERFIVLGLAGGKLQVVSTQTRQLVWETKIPAEIVAVAISSEEVPTVAVFSYRRNSAAQHQPHIAFFKGSAKPVDQVSFEGRFEQLAMSPNGQFVVLSGNNPHGQALVGFLKDKTSDMRFKEVWHQKITRYSDYTSPLAIMEDRIIYGFEESAPTDPGQSMAHLYAFDPQGKVEWNIPLVSEEGGYLFAYSRDKSGSPTLVDVSDTGEMNAYELQ
jgi:outer membrane protein assembly factor BamB